MKDFLRILAYARDYKRYIFLNFLFYLITVLAGVFSLSLTMPFLKFLFNNEAIVPVEKTSGFFNEKYGAFIEQIQSIIQQDKVQALYIISGLLIISILVKNVSRYLALYYMVFMRNYAIRDIRNKIYKKFISLSPKFYNSHKKGDLMSRISNDIKEIEWAMMTSLEAFIKVPLTILIYFGVLVMMSPKLTLYVILFLPIASTIIALIGKSLKRRSNQNQLQQGNYFSFIEESLTGIKIIGAFVAGRRMKKKHSDVNDETTRLNIKVNHKVDLASPISETMGVILSSFIIVFGGKLVFEGNLAAEVFVGYFAIFSQLIPPFKQLSNAFYNIKKGTASMDRIEEILHAKVDIQSEPNALEMTGLKTGLSFKNVSFSYGDQKVLDNINFEIEKGKMVALVGPSGGGKSTISDLVLRFYDVDNGEILIDGQNIQDYNIDSWRNQTAIVTQESILFNDTIANNISFGLEKVNKNDIEHAAELANALDFITDSEDGFATQIGDRGGKLSGGQKQRICIARAILKNPDLLILDEATSALDNQSEQKVQVALTELMKNRTSLVIAHRLSTVKDADQILVLDKGKIIESGSYKSLIDEKGVFYNLNFEE